MNWTIESVGEGDRVAALDLLFSGAGAAETRAQTEQALERINAGQADARALVWATLPVGSMSAVGVCWIEGQAGNVGYVHPPLVHAGLPERMQCERKLFEAALEQARGTGLTWLQTLVDSTNKISPLLQRLGLAPVGTLVYQAALPPYTGREPTALRIRSLSTSYEQHSLLADVLSSTYIDTLDCPALNGTRSAAETLDSYTTIGQSGTRHWQLIYQGESLIGCLLLAVHKSEAAGASAFGELVYWGVMPSARGHGLGREILELALWQATQLQLDKLVLAVDSANTPALRLYQELGFFEWLRKEAWGMQVPG